MTANYFRDSASSPEAYERLRRVQREYFARGDMSADRLEIMEAVWAAYPLTDREWAQLRGWGFDRPDPPEQGAP